MKTSGLREILESPQTVAAAAAHAKITHTNVVLHFSNGEMISSRVTLIRDSTKKPDEMIVELAATESSRITLFVPRDDHAVVYAKVWPR